FEYSNILRITTGERRTRLTEFALHQNYPNPFNTSTTIKYSLPDIGTPQALLHIDIYNILGETVRTLKNEPSRSGNFQVHWNGENNAGQLVNSGIYMISVTYGGYSQVRKLVFVK
ncbi:MAG: T9SS type A sorting domain-containing protein, partial [Candidatus Lokiarchaeota archaeon]|nr:T9SS type A sorting domain-containing protein [Candidatus Lokiarchaeota archaeon]